MDTLNEVWRRTSSLRFSSSEKLNWDDPFWLSDIGGEGRRFGSLDSQN